MIIAFSALTLLVGRQEGFCFHKIQIGFTFLVPAHLGSPGNRAVKLVCVCVCVRACVRACVCVCQGRRLQGGRGGHVPQKILVGGTQR